MSRRPAAAPLALAALLVLGAAGGLSAQQGDNLRTARALYDALNYDSAIAVARRALAAPRVAAADRAALYELLGGAFASLDSTSASVEAFRELILIDPDREPDPRRVSPRITSRYSLALAQVLVVRRLGADTAAFVAGEGRLPIRFQVSRAAIVRTRLVGPGVDQTIDSASLAGSVTVAWNGLVAGGTPPPVGRYSIVVEATAGRERDARAMPVHISVGTMDTTAHLTTLPGYDWQAETETPPRNWGPLGIAAVYAGAGVAASMVLRNGSLGSALPGGLVTVGLSSLTAGFVLSLSRPEPRPVPSAVLYNRLLRELLDRRNAQIAEENATRLRKSLVSVLPFPEAAP